MKHKQKYCLDLDYACVQLFLKFGGIGQLQPEYIFSARPTFSSGFFNEPEEHFLGFEWEDELRLWFFLPPFLFALVKSSQFQVSVVGFSLALPLYSWLSLALPIDLSSLTSSFHDLR